MARPSDPLEGRRRRHRAVAARLAAMPDEKLAVLLTQGVAWRAHAHGGQSGVVEVDGVKTFVKKLALTDLERAPRNQGSTANLFELPLFYQYGVGSAGFGAWRELAAYLKAGDWALSGECPHFPLVHHWRVTPMGERAPLAPELQAWLDRTPAYWDRSEAVRARLDALFSASAAVVLVLEYMPEMLQTWLARKLAEAPRDAAAQVDVLRVHDQLQEVVAFMNDRGMLHFDLNASNILVGDDQVYVADFGLTLCEDFALSPAERAFFDAHRLYDRCYLDWLFVERLAPKEDPPALAPALRAVVDRGRSVAAILGSFFTALREESKLTPYPSTELEAALAGTGS